VPFAFAVKLTPGGSVPDSVIAGSGTPVAVTVKVFAEPATSSTLAGLVIVGAAEATTETARVWVAGVPVPFEAVRLRS
jgi:hypothetical protein